MSYPCNKITLIKKLYTLLLSVALIWFMWSITGVHFETNDDRYINSILSGVLSGKPDPIVFHINYFVSAPLAFLYHITVKIPWYGLFLTSVYLGGYFILFDCLLKKMNNLIEIIGISLVGITVCLSFWYIIAQIQFTSTTIFLASIGYFCLFFEDDAHKGLLKFSVIETLACLIRKDAMLLVQPIGLGAYFGFLLLQKNKDIKAKVKQVLYPCCVVIFALTVELLGRVCGGYFNTDLQSYKEMNDERVFIADYHCAPDYEEIADILNKHNITQNQYEAYFRYGDIDYSMSTECLTEIAQYIQNVTQRNVYDIVIGLKKVLFEYKPWNYDKLSWILFIGVIILSAVTKDITVLSGAIGLECGKFFVWGFLYYRGRVLNRVSIPLFFCETIILFSFCLLLYMRTKMGVKLRCFVYTASISFILLIGLKCIYPQGKDLANSYQSRTLYMNALNEVVNYCEDHEEYNYILDAWSFGFFCGSAYETKLYKPSNYIFNGWFGNLPSIRHRITDFVSSVEGIHYIILDENNSSESVEVNYLRNLTNSEPVVQEKIHTSIGIDYAVLYFPDGN